MKRELQWKQDTPRMQIATLLQSAQGDVGNVASLPLSQLRRAVVLQRALAVLAAAQDILRDMPEGEWDAVASETRKEGT